MRIIDKILENEEVRLWVRLCREIRIYHKCGIDKTSTQLEQKKLHIQKQKKKVLRLVQSISVQERIYHQENNNHEQLLDAVERALDTQEHFAHAKRRGELDLLYASVLQGNNDPNCPER